MIINYDIQKINTLLEDLYKAKNINMNLLRPDFSYVGGSCALLYNDVISRVCRTEQNGSFAYPVCPLFLIWKAQRT